VVEGVIRNGSHCPGAGASSSSSHLRIGKCQRGEPGDEVDDTNARLVLEHLGRKLELVLGLLDELLRNPGLQLALDLLDLLLRVTLAGLLNDGESLAGDGLGGLAVDC
jgi:hypothetical protein